MTPFARAVQRAVRAIPAGRVSTYGDIAMAAGRPGAARAVGAILHGSGGGLPYHRVVGADGRVGGAAAGPRDGGVRDRSRRLRREGVAVAADGRIAGFARRRWPD